MPIQKRPLVILAPMAGITDAPFRSIAFRFGVDMAVSEMIASEALVRGSRRSFRMLDAASGEKGMVVQLFGHRPEVMADAAGICQDRGAAAIDINMGCPQPKVVRTGAGAALMKTPELACRIMEAVRGAVSVPVTLKMRLGWDHRSFTAVELARKAQDRGISMITVHGRTRSQMFSGRADWRAIESVVRAVSVPVIANGDIRDADSAVECLAESGASGVMVGRGALGRPWVFREIQNCLSDRGQGRETGPGEVYRVVMKHLEMVLSHYGQPAAVWMARKHLGWYSRGLKNGAVFRQAVNRCSNFSDLTLLARRFFESIIRDQGRAPGEQ